MNEQEKQLDKLFPDGFIGIRSGIREHLDAGRFVGYDWGIYSYLHVIATWKTGIAYTNAVAIGNKLSIPARSVIDSLERLREIQFINYPKGDGSRGLYPILIHKFRPTHGALKGYELYAFAFNNFEGVHYDHSDGRHVDAAWKPRADHADTTLMTCGRRVLTACIQDSKDGQDGVQHG